MAPLSPRPARLVIGKDGNPLNGVELICDSLMTNDGVLRASSVIRLDLEQSVTEIGFGDRIRLTADQLERLAEAFLAELERRFVQT